MDGSTPPSRGCIRWVDQLGPDDVYIGRGHVDKRGRALAKSKWSNPFKLNDCADVNECIDRFDAHLRSSARLMADLTELRGKRLLCHCATGARCHGDALITAYTELLADTVIDASVSVGVFHGEVEFARQALQLSHPYEHHALTDDLRRGLLVRAQCSQEALVLHQDSLIDRWARRG